MTKILRLDAVHRLRGLRTGSIAWRLAALVCVLGLPAGGPCRPRRRGAKNLRERRERLALGARNDSTRGCDGAVSLEPQRGWASIIATCDWPEPVGFFNGGNMDDSPATEAAVVRIRRYLSRNGYRVAAWSAYCSGFS